MTRFLIFTSILFMLSGCLSSLVSQQTQTRSATLTRPPEVVYRQSRDILTRMGTQLTSTDGTTFLTGTLHDAMTITVHVAAVSDGTKVDALGVLLPNKLVIGSMTEVDEFMSALQQQGQAYAR